VSPIVAIEFKGIVTGISYMPDSTNIDSPVLMSAN
jgi:hypothetical protein